MLDALLARCTFPAPGTPVRCGVSGGADSLALLVLASRAELKVTAVHVDHGLRPGSADEAAIVARAANRFGAGFESLSVTIEDGSDLEQRAREARHSALGAGALTGHTADDQAETVLINLLRGAGIDGLAGIRPGPTHPILDLRRAETEAVCRGLDLDVVEDPSNADPRFQRNRIRHELLPLLADIGRRDPVPLLARTALVNRSIATDLDTLAAELDPTDTRALALVPATLAHRVLRRWLVDERGHPPSKADIERVMAVVRHETSACEVSGFRRVARTNGVLRVEPTSGPTAEAGSPSP